MEKSVFYIYSRQYLSFKERLLSKSDKKNSFCKACKLEKGTLVLHRHFKVNIKSCMKLQPLKTGPYKIMRRTIEVKYELMSPQGKFSFAQRNQLIPFDPHHRIFRLFISKVQKCLS